MEKNPGSPPDIVTDFAAADFPQRLHERYAAFQRDTPVFRNQEGVVYLTRYEDCAELLTDKRFRRRSSDDSTDPFEIAPQEPDAFHVMIGHWMMFMDPPRHDALRQVFAPPFAGHAIARLEPTINAVVGSLIETLREKDRADLVADFASPLPTLVMCEILGIPPPDLALFNEWTARLVRAFDTTSGEDVQAAVPACLGIRDYFLDALDSLPAGGKDSYFGSLAAATEAGRLTRDELVHGCALLLLAGHETTKNLITSAILALIQHPAQMESFRALPGLAESAVEEFLRYVSPIQKLSRWTSERALFGQWAVPRGTLVTALIGAANRDPAVFGHPQELDIRRSPNRHLALGRGIHSCLGAVLARLESRVAISGLLGEYARIEAVDYRWRANSSLRCLEYLSVSLR